MPRARWTAPASPFSPPSQTPPPTPRSTQKSSPPSATPSAPGGPPNSREFSTPAASPSPPSTSRKNTLVCAPHRLRQNPLRLHRHPQQPPPTPPRQLPPTHHRHPLHLPPPRPRHRHPQKPHHPPLRIRPAQRHPRRPTAPEIPPERNAPDSPNTPRTSSSPPPNPSHSASPTPPCATISAPSAASSSTKSTHSPPTNAAPTSPSPSNASPTSSQHRGEPGPAENRPLRHDCPLGTHRRIPRRLGPLAGRECIIADASFHRPLELEIASVFGTTPFNTTAKINKHVYDTLEQIIRAHRTTLIFTNLRAATERVTFQLRKRFATNPISADGSNPTDIIAPAHIEAHHSSLDRDVRLDIERRLKAGELRAVVCSTSLELGIDIGTIDRVILLNSPQGRRPRSPTASAAPATASTPPPAAPSSPPSPPTSSNPSSPPTPCANAPSTPSASPKTASTSSPSTSSASPLQSQPHGIDTHTALQIARRTLPFATLTEPQFLNVLEYVATSNLHDSTHITAKVGMEGTTGQSTPQTGELIPQSPSPLRPPSSTPSENPSPASTPKTSAPSPRKPRSKSASRTPPSSAPIEEAFAQILKPGDCFHPRRPPVSSSSGASAHVRPKSSNPPATPPPSPAGTPARMAACEPAFTSRWARVPRSKIPQHRCRPANPPSPTSSSANTASPIYVAKVSRPIPPRPTPPRRHPRRRPAIGRSTRSRMRDATVLVFHTMIGRCTAKPLPASPPAACTAASVATPPSSSTATTPSASGSAQTTAARAPTAPSSGSLLTLGNFDADLTTALEASELFKSQFRFTAISAPTPFCKTGTGRRCASSARCKATPPNPRRPQGIPPRPPPLDPKPAASSR